MSRGSYRCMSESMIGITTAPGSARQPQPAHRDQGPLDVVGSATDHVQQRGPDDVLEETVVAGDAQVGGQLIELASHSGDLAAQHDAFESERLGDNRPAAVLGSDQSI